VGSRRLSNKAVTINGYKEMKKVANRQKRSIIGKKGVDYTALTDLAGSWYHQTTVKSAEQSQLYLQNKKFGQAGHSCYTQATVATHFYIVTISQQYIETEEFPMTTTTNHETFNESFVYYASFARMIARIPDRDLRLQAYEMVFDYAIEGIEPQLDNWVLAMVFHAVQPQIDANNKRRANGKKGGRKPAQPAQAQPAVQSQPVMQSPPAVQTTPVMQAAPTAKNDNLLEPLNKIVYFGENKYPTTPTELGRFEKFAYKLFAQYHDGKPNLADIERVLERTYTRVVRPNGEAIAAFDMYKADLLDYVFEKAKAADKLNWKYVDGLL